MLEPRTNIDVLARGDTTFLGGTENFDLWWRTTDLLPPQGNNYPLRIYRVAGGATNWDVFRVPLRNNTKRNNPEHNEQHLGFWKDVVLSPDDVDHIEAYLTCFAPWTLGQSLTGEDDV
jgi:hypothetical protein